jgi:hypothetical protein
MSRPHLDRLEPRNMLATYGNPWPEASRLTFSFAPDSTPLVSLNSKLFASLNATLPQAAWQSQVARALQTWVVHTDLTIGHRADSGATFGTTGFTLGDPRFGDIRIGAHDMTPGVLAVSVPYDPARAGTLTGDIFLNSSYAFSGQPYDLTTVLLHEAGHVFGLDHSSDPASPMFARFNNPISTLTPADIAAIRALYGNRAPDRFDAAGANNQIGDAVPIPTPNVFNGAAPLAVFGDLTSSADVDYYKFNTPSDDNGYTGPMTIRLQTSGISLMRPSLRVFNSAGVQVGSLDSSSWLGDTLSLTLNVTGDDNEFFLRVDSPAADEFAVGRYALAVFFNATNQATPASIDNVLTGPHENATAEELRQLFLDSTNVYLNADAGANNSIGSSQLIEFTGTTPRTELIGSIESTTDVDFYRATVPGNASAPVTINLWTTDPRGLIPTLRLTDSNGSPIASRVVANGNRTVTLQLDSVSASTEITIEVSGQQTGNYFFTIDRTTPLSQLRTVASGSTLSGRVGSRFREPRVDVLYIAEAQLMHLLLTALPHNDPTARLTMQIQDLAGTVVYSLTALQGTSASAASVFLVPGEYRVRYIVQSQPTSQALARTSSSTSAGSSLTSARRGDPLLEKADRFAIERVHTTDLPQMQFRVQVASLSGPIGPSLRDIRLRPRYLHPSIPDARLFPTGRITRENLEWVAVVV